MRSLTDSLAGIAGWVLFVGLCINFLMDRGQHWKIGSLGMPEIVVGPDGMHYPDGAVIDPVTLSLHQSGMEQEGVLGTLRGAGTGTPIPRLPVSQAPPHEARVGAIARRER